jgi:benzoyl-CoA reductase/2-hydroxyglutaryl-CoA dehydratase subunit BcrC/BadD/HgdB
MSEFFSSDLVKDELDQINKLQEEICGSFFTFSSLTHEEKMEHIDKLKLLLEKQKIMYTRMSLSDDPQAIETKERLQKSAEMMGFTSSTDLNTVFDTMNATIESLISYLDKGY